MAATPPSSRLRRQALKDILQIRIRAQPVEPGRLHQAHDRSRTLASTQRAGEQPVRTSKRDWPYLVLYPVVVDGSDLRRVEVLKGAQGTPYGAGAAGLVRYATVPANTQRFCRAISVGASSVKDDGTGSNLRAAVNIPLSENVLDLRIGAFNRTEAGYVEIPFNGEADNNKARIKGGRVAVDSKVNADWSVRAWALTQNFKSDGIGSEDVLAPSLKALNLPLQRIAYVPEIQDISLDVANVTVRGLVGNFEKPLGETALKSASFDQLKATYTYWRIAGAVLVAAALGWFLLEQIAAAKFPAYSFARNYISDLGVPELGTVQGRTLNSPLSLVANFMFVSQGVLFLLAAVLVVRTATAGVGRWLFLLLALGYAIGYVVIGTYHGSEQAVADGTFALHVLGGSLAVVCGNLAIIVAGLSAHRLGASPAYRNFSLGASALGIASLAILMATSGSATDTMPPSGPWDGIWERGGCYALILWELVTGVVLLKAAQKSLQRR